MFTFLRKKIIDLVAPILKLHSVGVDISDRSVKFLEFHPQKKILTNFSEIEIPAGIVENGEIRDSQKLSEMVRSWLSGEGKIFQKSFVVVSLPEEKSFLRVIQLPKIKKEDIVNAIRWEIEANIPLPPNEVIYDYDLIEPESQDAGHFDVMITAFPKSVIESYVEVIKKSGLRLLAIELESQAILRGVKAARNQDPKIVIDIGRTRTNLIVYTKGVILYTTTVSFGGEILEEALAKDLRITKEQALSIKKEIGFNRNAQDGRIFKALLTPISLLADELRKTITYYQTHATHGQNKESGPIKEIILVGGDANLFGLSTYLSSTVKISVEMADPLLIHLPLGAPIPLIPRHLARAYVTAIGLAARGM